MTIELKNIAKDFATTNILHDINFTIQDGEFFVMVGPSGSGKSTILRMIAGLTEISQGELLIDDVVANDFSPKDRNLSMVFQNYALYPNMNVADNILFGLRARKVNAATQQSRLTDALAMVGLTEFAARFPRELSGGQRQRVALARTIVSNAKITLMDEPLSNLDAQLREKMRTEIKDLQQRLGLTVIYVTHDQTEAMTMGDRVMVINDGQVQQIGTPLDLYNTPANEFVAKFFGTPQMNVLRGYMNPQHKLELSPDGAFLFGIRPDSVYLTARQTNDLALAGQVSSYASLGNATLVNVQMADQAVQFKLQGQHTFNHNQSLVVHVPQHAVHYFDAATGSVLTATKVG
ncbi:ABC transporter ATP-binding protein [Periweissella cryptocerci]|uniref:ABC transporter ATP-binding protein n=1 Tax=Periweissella cryptocerci TaxID=2506420 RepID=A0A4P6YR77_9LACO|nr:ABC transporter ATP-binding protein [Periweissella cryptocerci]QBO35092.1 ABC transporter ATP-binding protein [Periweissella cryptocerci]